jgi:hypothetical protein
MIDNLLDQSYTPSKTEIRYPEKPVGKETKWGWKIYSYLKYSLRPN